MAATTSATTASDSASPELATLVSEVASKFEQATYTDSSTGQTLPYNIYVPDGYDESKSYPMVLYIADSSLVGQDVTAPLSQYGALIWAYSAEQAKHESIVVVPEFPSVIIDDHGSFTTTEYVEMTARLVKAMKKKYSIDSKRVYGTGQSMGCMTVMYLAAKHTDLFAAELFVSGQWEISQLDGLTEEKFFYIAAGGDPNASAGQEEVKAMLEEAEISYQSAEWDATWSAEEMASAAAELFAAGDSVNFATFKTGTVLEVAASSTSTGDSAATSSSGDSSAMGTPPSGMSGPPSGAGEGSGTPPSGAPSGSSGSSGGGGDSSEHMASFEPAYKVEALRDWLFEQSA